MKFLLGYKNKMTQVFTEDGTVVPVTIVKTGELTITQVKNKEKDGYDAVQVGFGERSEKNLNKPQREALKDLGAFAVLKEFRVEGGTYQRGDKIGVDTFQKGDVVNVSGVSKGKGFQGVVKRHNFAGGPKSHGQKHSLRAPGSIGSTGPQRVFKGKKMAGRMGTDRITVKNLEIVDIDADNNLIMIKGALPGRPGTLLEIISK